MGSKSLSPEPETVKRGRLNKSMSAEEAATLVSVSARQWNKYESGKARMNGSLWLHFCTMTGQVKPDV